MKMSLWCVNLALVKGCTRKCGFCGIHSLPKEEKFGYKFMPIDLVEKIVNDLKEFRPNMRVEFSLFGEPLVHPEIYEIIELFRNKLPKIQLSIVSNGDRIQNDSVDINQLFLAGLDYLMIDFYNRGQAQRDELNNKINVSGVSVYDYFKDKKSIWGYNKKDRGSIIIVDDLSNTQSSITRKYHTVGGNMLKKAWKKYGIGENQFPVMKRCGKIFTEIVIDYDGTVPFCCVDWLGKNVLGNVNNKSIKDIYYSEKLEKYRYLIYHKRRDLVEVCSLCNNTTPRTGLLEIRKEFPGLIEEFELRKNKNNL